MKFFISLVCLLLTILVSVVIWFTLPPVDSPGSGTPYVLVFYFCIWLFYHKLAKYLLTKYQSQISAKEKLRSSPPEKSEQFKSVQNSSTQRLCEFIWFELDQYVKHADPLLSHQSQMHLWGIYFYVIVRTIKDQQFIDSIYSYFDSCATARLVNPNSRIYTVDLLRKYYREIRIPLNELHIDPANDDGQNELWSFTVAHIYGDCSPPSNSKKCFLSAVNNITRLSKLYYTKANNSSNYSTRRFSISPPDDSTKLPNE